jgi:hypothetical protein
MNESRYAFYFRSIIWECLWDLKEEAFDFIVSERLRLQSFFVFCCEVNRAQFSQQQAELVLIVSEAPSEKAPKVLLCLLLGHSGLPFPARSEVTHVIRCDIAREELGTIREKLLEQSELIFQFAFGRSAESTVGTLDREVGFNLIGDRSLLGRFRRFRQRHFADVETTLKFCPLLLSLFK